MRQEKNGLFLNPIPAIRPHLACRCSSCESLESCVAFTEYAKRAWNDKLHLAPVTNKFLSHVQLVKRLEHRTEQRNGAKMEKLKLSRLLQETGKGFCPWIMSSFRTKVSSVIESNTPPTSMHSRSSREEDESGARSGEGKSAMRALWSSIPVPDYSTSHWISHTIRPPPRAGALWNLWCEQSGVRQER